MTSPPRALGQPTSVTATVAPTDARSHSGGLDHTYPASAPLPMYESEATVEASTSKCRAAQLARLHQAEMLSPTPSLSPQPMSPPKWLSSISPPSSLMTG